MIQFLTFRKFRTKAEARYLTKLLEENNIHYELEDNSKDVPDYFIGVDMEHTILVKIAASDFETAQILLSAQATKLAEDIDQDHYLFGFTDEELVDVIKESDTWNEIDVALAKKILSGRGIHITHQEEEMYRSERINSLKQVEKKDTLWTLVGYVSAFMGGFLGIAIGLILWRVKKTLPNGERVYVYAPNDRQHGKIITFIGVFMSIFFFCIFLNKWADMVGI